MSIPSKQSLKGLQRKVISADAIQHHDGDIELSGPKAGGFFLVCQNTPTAICQQQVVPYHYDHLQLHCLVKPSLFFPLPPMVCQKRTAHEWAPQQSSTRKTCSEKLKIGRKKIIRMDMAKIT